MHVSILAMIYKELAWRAAKAMDLKVHFPTKGSYSKGANVGIIKDWERQKE